MKTIFNKEEKCRGWMDAGPEGQWVGEEGLRDADIA
jgi:hypothetical protein